MENTVKNWNFGILPAETAVGENIVILQVMFKYLGGESLKSCRMVNKTWKYVADQPFKKRMQVNFVERRRLGFRFYSLVEHPRKSTLNFISAFRDAQERFLLDSFKFKFGAGLFRDHVDIEFLALYGRSIKHLSVSVDKKNKWLPVTEVVVFRNHVLTHLSHMEELSVKLYVHLEREFTVANFINGALLSAGGSLSPMMSLSGLKTLRFYLTVYDGEGHPARAEVDKLIKILFFSIINNAGNLQCLIINLFPAKIETLLEIPVESLRKLKEMRLNDWKCSDRDVRQSLRMLIALGEKGDLKLNSLSLDFQLGYCLIHRHYCPTRLQSIVKLLLEFLTTQRKHLKSLRIKLARFSRDNVPFSWTLDRYMIFPRMQMLEKLDISHSNGMFMPFFENNQTCMELFPKLKELEYSCLVGTMESVIPKFVLSVSSDCPTVTNITLNTKLHINSNVFASNSLQPGFIRTLIPSFYIAIQRNFPGLKTLKINHQNFGRVFMSTSEHFEDISSYYPAKIISGGASTSRSRGGQVALSNYEDDDFNSDGDSEIDYVGGVGFYQINGQHGNGINGPEAMPLGVEPPYPRQAVRRIVVQRGQEDDPPFNGFHLPMQIYRPNERRQNNVLDQNIGGEQQDIDVVGEPNVAPQEDHANQYQHNPNRWNAGRNRDGQLVVANGEVANFEIDLAPHPMDTDRNLYGQNAADEERQPTMEVAPGQPPSVLVGRFIVLNRGLNPPQG